VATAAERTFEVLAGGKATIERDPNDELDYTLGWSTFLARSGNDTIASVNVAATDVEVYDTTHNDTTVTIWVRGGTASVRGSARVRIVTNGVGAQPRTKDCTVYFKTKEQ